ncbi:Muniscin C-terminal mu homology domain-domain-containing protein [Leucosporidium creatinivorum]|uniref:Muniscin C-terminal mu homology domain-domain-containing protein n=1 Tax=Leucosporidium creatinivorum TaxID=106004 RepID=A0A1Y2FS03_9BASI|nr:Muniscin C-terminal mu homology domain-domain-containing protein [Leucosporidium creatinivorum]
MSGSSIYQDSFGRARPNLAYQAVNRRLNLTRALTTDLAAYYEERALVEETYIKALQKLSSRLHGSGSSTVLRAVEDLGLEQRDEDRQLGAWSGVRAKLEQEITDTAKVHETWRKKVLEEVEGPLRQSVSKSDWARWQQGDAQLGSTVKEYDSTLDKVQKGQSKASKSSKATSSKLLTAQSQLSTLGSSLTSALPAYLAQSQALDESHSAFLKEALVRAGTCSSDLGRERMEAGERLLVNVLGVDEQVEMQTWALRESMRAGGQSGSNGSVGAGINEFGANNSIREESIAEEPAQSTLRAPVPERQRVPSISRTAPPPVAPLPLPVPSTTPSKSGGGLKSLFKRDRSSSVAGSSKYGNLDVPSNGSTSNVNLASPSRPIERQSMDSRDSESVNQPEDAFGTIPQPSFDRQNSGSSYGGGSSIQAPIQPTRGASGSSNGGSKKRESLMPFASGGLFRRQSKITPMPNSESPSQERRESEGGLDQPPTIQEGVAQTGGAAVDEEGYSLPPAGYDRDIGATAAGPNNLMDDDEDEASDMPSALQSSKLPAVALAPATITESDADRQAALDRVKSTLLSSSSAPASNLARRQTRGRRDVRMTTFNPQRAREQAGGDQASLSNSLSATSPTASTFLPERANSMLSTVSHGTTRTTGGPDPFEHATTPGLRATITETVNVLSKGGEVNRVMITGEIALSHRLDSSANPEGLKIRIANFEQFEKAAPNSAYLSSVADSPGEYQILPSLSANNSHTATVLKYQLHIPEGAESACVPLNVKALWQCQPAQTRVIVNYSANSQARIAEKEESPFGEDDDETTSAGPKLEELSFAVPVSAPVTTFQAKPSAIWAAEKARLTFNVEPVAFGEEGKVLASVSTEGTAVAQPVAVRWKVVGRNVSKVGIEVIDGEQVEELLRSTVSGKYLVAP